MDRRGRRKPILSDLTEHRDLDKMHTMKKHTPLADMLRASIAESPDSLRKIAADCGIWHASLSRFMTKQASLRLDVAERLCAHFGIEHKRRA